MRHLDRPLEAERISAGRRRAPAPAGRRSEHRGQERRDTALVLHVDGGAVIDEVLNNRVVAQSGGNVECGIAGLVRRFRVAAELDGGSHRLADSAFRLHLAEVDCLDAAPARRPARSHSRGRHHRVRAVGQRLMRIGAACSISL